MPFVSRSRQDTAAMGLMDAEASVPGESAPVGEDPGGRPGVVSIREAPLASGARAPLYSALPYAMSALPTGSVTAELRNPSGRDVMVGFRTEQEGLDLRLPAGASKRAMIPPGAYTLIMQPIDEPGRLFESGAVVVPPGSSSIAVTIGPVEAVAP